MRKSHLRAADPEMAFETNKPRCDLGSCSTVLNLQMRTLRSKEVKEIVQGYSCQVKETKGNYVFGLLSNSCPFLCSVPTAPGNLSAVTAVKGLCCHVG